MAQDLPATIPHVAAAAAERWGDALAIVEGDICWTFAELWQQCRGWASALLAYGIGPGDRIAIWAPNSRHWVVASIAAMTCGASVVPVNTRLKGQEAADILRRTRARIVFSVKDFLGIDFAGLLAGHELPHLEKLLFFDEDMGALLDQGQGAGDPQIDKALAGLVPDTVSDIMFTSGTTGVPKGVLTTHDAIIVQVAAWIERTGLRQEDRYLIVNPFFHSYGMKVGWVACLMSGATCFPMPQFDVAEAISLIERHRISFLPGPPTIFQMLLRAREERPFDTSSLRGGTTGAASVPPVLVDRIRNELGMTDIITAYGMTECTVITACTPGDETDRIARTCGKVIAGIELRIADEEGRTLASGEGEVLIRGTGLMLGYLDNSDATRQAIDDDGWLHTGDVGVIDSDGCLRITDRKKDMYISGGFNCYPAEIERLISGHPAIDMVAVVGTPDERMGEVGSAFIVLRPGADLTGATLIAWCRANMANYKVPRHVHFLGELPRNAAGKIAKQGLREGKLGGQ